MLKEILLNTTKDVILNNVDKKTTNTVNANVVEEPIEDFDYDAFKGWRYIMAIDVPKTRY